MAYLGKEYVMEKQERYDEFVKSLKLEIPADVAQKFTSYTPIAKMEKNGDEYKYTSNKFDGGTSTLTFKNGVEFEETNFGRTSKVVITVDGDTFTQVLKFPEGTITFTRQFFPDKIVVTIKNSNWDGEAKRFYKAK